jgi:FkbM family methyltransferase
VRNLIFRVRGRDHRKGAVNFYKNIIKKGDLVFDVGANRGQTTEIYTMLGARVVSFEPQKALHKRILQVAYPGSNLTIREIGLGSKNERLQFHTVLQDQMSSFRSDWIGEKTGSVEIQVETLDQQISEFGMPAYCKIDVEGWEIEVVSGLSNPIPLISFEYHESPTETAQAFEVLKQIQLIGDYKCNIRLAGSHSFALNDFIALSDFISLFPNNLGIVKKSSYGDIFCKLDA